MATISSWIRSFSASVRFNAFALFLQLLKCSSFFSSFQGAAKTVDGKPESAFKMFVGGSDKLGAAKFGEAGAVILERDLPKLLVELGKAAASNMNWETWIAGHGDEFRAIVEKYA